MKTDTPFETMAEMEGFVASRKACGGCSECTECNQGLEPLMVDEEQSPMSILLIFDTEEEAPEDLLGKPQSTVVGSNDEEAESDVDSARKVYEPDEVDEFNELEVGSFEEYFQNQVIDTLELESVPAWEVVKKNLLMAYPHFDPVLDLQPLRRNFWYLRRKEQDKGINRHSSRETLSSDRLISIFQSVPEIMKSSGGGSEEDILRELVGTYSNRMSDFNMASIIEQYKEWKTKFHSA